MSTAETGAARVIAEAVADAKELLSSDRAEELRQMELLDQPTPEEMLEAREAVGRGAGKLVVLAEARERRRGRPKGSLNKRTDDFARWILSFGQHPAKTMMEIQSTPTEVLMEASGKSYLECLDRKIRCAEGLLPYLESKKPVAVDINATGDFNLIVPGRNVSEEDAQRLLDGGEIEIGEWTDGDEPG